MKYLLMIALVFSGTLTFAKSEKAASRKPAQKPTSITFKVTDKLNAQDIYNMVDEVGLKRPAIDVEISEGIIKCRPSGSGDAPSECTITRALKDKSDY